MATFKEVLGAVAEAAESGALDQFKVKAEDFFSADQVQAKFEDGVLTVAAAR